MAWSARVMVSFYVRSLIHREKRAQREAEAEAGRLAREAREEARRQRQEEARRAEMAQKKALLSDYREERERAAMEELAR